jgi:hypothetical protein
MTITLTREEAQQVLDALQCATPPTFSAKIVEDWQSAIETLRTRLAQPEPKKLWLWKNFVDGRPEYWAFDNPYPTNLEDGDPQTLGQPCGYAIFKPSRDGSNGRTEEQVLREMASVKSKAQPEPEPVACDCDSPAWCKQYKKCHRAMLGFEPYVAPPQREWQGLTDEEIEKGRDQTFSINNPYCPCDSKTMRKAVRWAEAKLKEKNNG